MTTAIAEAAPALIGRRSRTPHVAAASATPKRGSVLATDTQTTVVATLSRRSHGAREKASAVGGRRFRDQRTTTTMVPAARSATPEARTTSPSDQPRIESPPPLELRRRRSPEDHPTPKHDRPSHLGHVRDAECSGGGSRQRPEAVPHAATYRQRETPTTASTSAATTKRAPNGRDTPDRSTRSSTKRIAFTTTAPERRLHARRHPPRAHPSIEPWLAKFAMYQTDPATRPPRIATASPSHSRRGLATAATTTSVGGPARLRPSYRERVRARARSGRRTSNRFRERNNAAIARNDATTRSFSAPDDCTTTTGNVANTSAPNAASDTPSPIRRASPATHSTERDVREQCGTAT